MRTSELSVRLVTCLGFGLALSLGAPLAAAKGDGDSAPSSKSKKKIVVGGFEGPKSGEARKALIAALKRDGAYDVTETSQAKPGSDDKAFASASAGASAVIVGAVKKAGLVVSVRNGADGSLVQDVEIKGGTSAKLNKNIESSASLSLADAISQTSPGSDAPKADASAADDSEKPASAAAAPVEDEPKAAATGDTSPYPDGHSPLELEAGLRAVHRSFAYHDTLAQLFPTRGYAAPRTYTLPLGPALFIAGTVYPLAFATRSFAGNIGITAGYETDFATKSVYDTADPNAASKTVENKLTTSANQYFAGLKARIPISVHELGLVAAYGRQVFNLLGDEAAPTVPDLFYKFVRVSAEGLFRFDAFTLGAHIGTRFVNSTGGLERDWFPGHVKTKSVEAGISAGYSLASSLELIAGFDVTRYAFDFNPVPLGSPVIAGGATDTFTSGFFGLRYSLPSHK